MADHKTIDAKTNCVLLAVYDLIGNTCITRDECIINGFKAGLELARPSTFEGARLCTLFVNNAGATEFG